jgi:hypothetical protein
VEDDLAVMVITPPCFNLVHNNKQYDEQVPIVFGGTVSKFMFVCNSSMIPAFSQAFTCVLISGRVSSFSSK